MDATTRFADSYLEEAADLLDEIQEVLLRLEADPEDADGVNRLFRAFHTIKGSGAVFGFDEIAGFTHHVETYLDRLRSGAARLDREVIDMVLAARDLIAQMLHGAADPRLTAELVDRFATRSSLGKAPATIAARHPAAPAAPGQVVTYRIRFRPEPDLFLTGFNPVGLLNELQDLGVCKIACDPDAVPSLADLDPVRCYFAWDVELATDRGESAIRDVFIFVEEGAEITITAAEAPPVAALPPRPAAGRPRPVGEIGGEASSVRVPAARLDRLVSLVGEFVINQARLGQVAARHRIAELEGVAEAMERLVADLRDSVLGIRMTPIGTTFTRFQRLVRDLSAELGKDVEFVAEGGETELDKTVLDGLADPLVHLIRNSLDHGLEDPAGRAAAAKPARGTIRLTAAHEGGLVRISLADDGRGLDRAAIRARAIEKGLITDTTELTEREIHSLVFAPGFSTAKQVSNVSGRGVGMDVVKRTVDGLRGTVAIESQPGRGATFHITLPLTLAIIEGLLVEVDGDPYLLPMTVVRENVELARLERRARPDRSAVAVRGELVPYIRLRDLFAAAPADPEFETIVVIQHGSDRVGFVVDRVHGSHQTVIQPLGRLYRDLSVASGTTILGDGRVALILDPAGIIATHCNHERTSST